MNEADAQEFASAMARHHRADLEYGDEETKNAVIVKMVALSSLAFGLSVTRDSGPWFLEVNETLKKLKIALRVLASKEQARQ